MVPASDPTRALVMAREVRNGRGDEHSPSALYAACNGDAALYNHAMREAGYVVPSSTQRAPAVCSVCGYDFGADHRRTDVTGAVSDGE